MFCLFWAVCLLCLLYSFALSCLFWFINFCSKLSDSICFSLPTCSSFDLLCCPNLLWFIRFTVWSNYMHWTVQSSLVQCAPGLFSAWVWKRSWCSLKLIPLSLYWPVTWEAIRVVLQNLNRVLIGWIGHELYQGNTGVPCVVLTRSRVCMLHHENLILPQWQGTYTHRNQCVCFQHCTWPSSALVTSPTLQAYLRVAKAGC